MSAFGALWSLLKYGLISTISVALAFAVLVHYTPQLGRQANAIRRVGRSIMGPLTGEEYALERLPPNVISPEIQDILERHQVESEDQLESTYQRLGLAADGFTGFGPTERVVHYYCARWRDDSVRKEWHDRTITIRSERPAMQILDELTQYLRVHCK